MPPERPSDRAHAWPVPRAGVDELSAFVAVARTGSVGRAAEALSRTQPTISARLASLEESWATRLFERTARGMSLTPEGATLLPRVETALESLRALDQAAGLPVAPAGELRLGSGDALGRLRLPAALARLLSEEPGVDIRLREGPGPELLAALRGGEIDLALVVAPAAGEEMNGLHLSPVLTSDVVLLTPVKSRFKGTRAVPLRRLAGERLVSLQPGSRFRAHVETAFAAAGVPFRPAIEVGNLSLVRRFVAAGLGVAPVPQVAFELRPPRRRVEAHRLSGIGPLTYHQAVRAGVPVPPAVARLMELLGA